MIAHNSPIPVLRSFVAGSSNAGGGFSPRPSSTRRLVDASPASLRTHPLPVSRAANSAQRQVVLIDAGIAVPARPSVAAEVFEEFELIRVSPFHAFNLAGKAPPCPTRSIPRAESPQADA